MKKTAALAVVAGTVLATALAGAGTASAETKLWTACRDVFECKLPSGFFPGGTISVDVDALSADPGLQEAPVAWRIGNCSGQVNRVDEPARSFICTLPASFYTLVTNSHWRLDYSIGLRWG